MVTRPAVRPATSTHPNRAKVSGALTLFIHCHKNSGTTNRTWADGPPSHADARRRRPEQDPPARDSGARPVTLTVTAREPCVAPPLGTRRNGSNGPFAPTTPRTPRASKPTPGTVPESRCTRAPKPDPYATPQATPNRSAPNTRHRIPCSSRQRQHPSPIFRSRQKQFFQKAIISPQANPIPLPKFLIF